MLQVQSLWQTIQRATSFLACMLIAETKSLIDQRRFTLPSPGQNAGKIVKVWRARMQDPVDPAARVLVVSCFDVTAQKRTELELQAMKGALQRCAPSAALHFACMSMQDAVVMPHSSSLQHCTRVQALNQQVSPLQCSHDQHCSGQPHCTDITWQPSALP